ncbi:MAG TPA: PfkB family carbohydrate kinase [Jatrophihabitantaceae bacterium]|jgi:sugar/nucleoside kinase (ribokinase family)
MTGALVPGARIVCLGDVMVDIVARLSGPVEIGSDRPARTELQAGGSAANTAAWLEHQAVSTTLLARVGSDVLGSWSLARLGRGLAKDVSIDPGTPTGTCIVLVSADGERTMVPDPGANAALSPAHVRPDVFAPTRHLHVSGYALFSGAREAAVHALSMARQARMTISVGAASVAPLRGLGVEAFFDLIGRDLLLFANRAEATLLTGQEDPFIAATVLSTRVGRAVVTDGAGTAIWADGDERAQAPAPPGTIVIDTTGAGDAFAAGKLAALAQGATPVDALAQAHQLAAQACELVGGRPPAPGR